MNKKHEPGENANIDIQSLRKKWGSMNFGGGGWSPKEIEKFWEVDNNIIT